MRLCVALLALAAAADAGRILSLFPHTGRSHHMVFEPYLRTLAERGHHVTTISFFPFKNPPPNYTDVSLEGIAPLGLATVDLSWFEPPEETSLLDVKAVAAKVLNVLGIDRIMKEMMAFSPLDEFALNVCRKLKDWPGVKEAFSQEYDLIIVEMFNSDCMLGLAHLFGVRAPIVALSSTGVMPWGAERLGLVDNPAFVPLISKDYTSQMSFLQRVENTFLNVYYKWWFRSAIQLQEQALLEQQFQRPVELRALARNVSLLIVNTHHALNGVRPLLPAVVEAGGMHLDDSAQPIPQWMERFLNESTEGVVLFSLGSLIRTASLPPRKERLLARALAALPQRVLWKHEAGAAEGSLEGNILKVPWVPQRALLQHPKVVAFVAHGGLLGMTEALAAGKPMLVMPFFGDQPSNGAAAAAAGLAAVVPYHALSEHAFAQALAKVLSPEMRASARQASAVWRDRPAPPLATAVYWTERVLRWGARAPLHSALRDLGWLEAALLDVAALALAAAAALALTLKYLISLVPKLLGSSTKQKMH